MLINHNDYEMKDGIFRLKDKVAVPTGKILFTLRNIHTGKITQELVDNMFVTAGKVAIAGGFYNSALGNITYMALGTSAVAPALADTQLTAELARKLISVRNHSGNVFTAQTFFTTSEANGTLREAGLFGDLASAVANSGTLFAKSAINRTKTSAETLTASWSITIG